MCGWHDTADGPQTKTKIYTKARVHRLCACVRFATADSPTPLLNAPRMWWGHCCLSVNTVSPVTHVHAHTHAHTLTDVSSVETEAPVAVLVQFRMVDNHLTLSLFVFLLSFPLNLYLSVHFPSPFLSFFFTILYRPFYLFCLFSSPSCLSCYAHIFQLKLSFLSSRSLSLSKITPFLCPLTFFHLSHYLSVSLISNAISFSSLSLDQ